MSWTVGNLRNTQEGIKCDRTSPLGNPFEMRSESERDAVVKAFRHYLWLVACCWEDPLTAATAIAEATDIEGKKKLEIASTWNPPQQNELSDALTELENKPGATLLCWCHPKPCHCDVIVRFLHWATAKPMKTIVAGSRSVEDYAVVKRAIADSLFNISEVVSGTAQGVDKLGERWAEEKGVPIKQFPADWKTHGKRAGYLRNKEMAGYADAAVIVWDGESKGTKWMIDLAKEKQLKLYVHQI